MPDGGEILATRVAFLELKDERRLIQEGYELLDEKRVLLATEIMRQAMVASAPPGRMKPFWRPHAWMAWLTTDSTSVPISAAIRSRASQRGSAMGMGRTVFTSTPPPGAERAAR